MPELLEVEAYRRLLEARAIGRPIAGVEAPDPWYLKEGLTPDTVEDALAGASLTSTGRHGKLLLAGTDRGLTLGLRFGMTGRLVVDGHAGVDQLLYTSERFDGRWIRFALRFADGGQLWMLDPRRLGGVLLDPDVSALGPDAGAVRPEELRARVSASRAPLKAFLLDQSRIAGIGNLMGDEILWRAGLDPERVTRSLDGDEVRALHRAIRETVETMARRGGSHTGDLMPHRMTGGRCPRDGAPLVRRTVGGRTTWSCPEHQR